MGPSARSISIVGIKRYEPKPSRQTFRYLSNSWDHIDLRGNKGSGKKSEMFEANVLQVPSWITNIPGRLWERRGKVHFGRGAWKVINCISWNRITWNSQKTFGMKNNPSTTWGTSLENGNEPININLGFVYFGFFSRIRSHGFITIFHHHVGKYCVCQTFPTNKRTNPRLQFYTS